MPFCRTSKRKNLPNMRKPLHQSAIRTFVPLVCAFQILITIGTPNIASSASSDDAKFRDLLNEVAPNLDFPQHKLDHKVEFSDAFAIASVPGLRPNDTAQEKLAKFVAQFDETGLPPVRLIVQTGLARPDVWTTNFPGCLPTQCNISVFDVTRSNKLDWHRYSHSSTMTSIERVELFDGQVGSTKYVATLVICLDYLGRATSYYITASKKAKSHSQKLRAALNNGGGSEYLSIMRHFRVLSSTQ